MAKKMTKSQAKRRMMEVRSKAMRLFQDGYFSMKDADNISKIINLRSKQL